MAKVTFSLSSRIDKQTGKSEIYLRFVAEHSLILRGRTGMYIYPNVWKNGTIYISKSTSSMERRELLAQQSIINELSNTIIGAYYEERNKSVINSDWLKSVIFHFNNPNTVNNKTLLIVDAFLEFCNRHRVGNGRAKQYQVLGRTLRRFCLYERCDHILSDLTTDYLYRFEHFVECEKYIFDNSKDDSPQRITHSYNPKIRGRNTVIGIMKRLRTFVRWAVLNELLLVDPFLKYKIGTECYGEPYYLTIEERKKVESMKMPTEKLSEQRDIFIFQCLTGCRIGDLYSLTRDNIVNGAVQYIAAKTKDERPMVVRVPLTETAKNIIDRYYNNNSKTLLPLIPQQKYNEAIKAILFHAKMNRIVTILNPKTRMPEQKPIWQLASSHMARRTFIGNLYKKVRDQELIAPMSGHVEGSKAFFRYRTIDEDINQETVSLLD